MNADNISEEMRTPDSNIGNAIASEVKNEVRNELISRSWEMELILSAAVIISLFQIPTLLTEVYDYVHYTIGSDITLVFADISLLALYCASYVLIANFSVHLILRSFWIGLIGLERAYPLGIRIERLSYPRFLREYLQEHLGQLDNLIKLTDRASSVIFSFTFLITGFLTFIAFINALIIVSALVLNLSGFTIGILLASCAITIILLPTFTTLMLDKFTDRFKPEWKESKRYERISKSVYHFISTATPRYFMAPIMYVLSTNIKRWKFILLVWMYVGGAALAGLIGAMGIVEYKGTIFFPENPRHFGIDAAYYENSSFQGKYSMKPSIQADMITDKYIRLFIPYNIRNNDSLLKYAGTLTPFVQEGLQWHFRQHPEATDEQIRQVISCFKNFYEIKLNDSLLDTSFLFYRHPKTGVKGIITYISVANAVNGRNDITVREKYSITTQEWVIPFWL